MLHQEVPVDLVLCLANLIQKVAVAYEIDSKLVFSVYQFLEKKRFIFFCPAFLGPWLQHFLDSAFSVEPRPETQIASAMAPEPHLSNELGVVQYSLSVAVVIFLVYGMPRVGYCMDNSHEVGNRCDYLRLRNKLSQVLGFRFAAIPLW